MLFNMKYDYFCNESCRSKNNKASRSQEGLFCHHIAENKEILLSTPEVARTHPYEYQKAENLVYANYLEHLLLHIKIVEEDEENRGLGLGGVLMICGSMNDYYRHGLASGWRLAAANQIKNKYNDYILVMQYFQSIINSNKFLKNLLPNPVLAQGWYGKICKKVYKDIYGGYHKGDITWSNANVLEYLESMHKQKEK